MRISIVTPSYNQAEFLRYTLESIHSQNYPDVEHIVMDGGSTDGSVDIIREYAPKLAYWQSQNDKGQSDAINQGMARTTGEILAYLNSDDALLPHSLACVADIFHKNSEIDFVYGAVETIDADNQVIPYPLIPSTLNWNQVLSNQITLPQQGVFWRRKVYQQLGDFDSSLHYRMDYDYWIRSLLAGFKWYKLDQFIAQYRVHSTSKSIALDEFFNADWKLILDRIYMRTDLPEEVINLKSLAYNYAHWHGGRSLFYANKRSESAQALRCFINGQGNYRHKLLASLMLFDCQWNTHLYDFFVAIYRRSRDLAPERRS